MTNKVSGYMGGISACFEWLFLLINNLHFSISFPHAWDTILWRRRRAGIRYVHPCSWAHGRCWPGPPSVPLYGITSGSASYPDGRGPRHVGCYSAVCSGAVVKSRSISTDLGWIDVLWKLICNVVFKILFQIFCNWSLDFLLETNFFKVSVTSQVLSFLVSVFIFKYYYNKLIFKNILNNVMWWSNIIIIDILGNECI